MLYCCCCCVVTVLLLFLLCVSAEDEADLGLVKSSLAAVLQMNTKVALVGLFDQIMSDDESVRDKGIKYVSGPLMDMRQKIFVRQPDNEKCLLQLVKKVGPTYCLE